MLPQCCEGCQGCWFRGHHPYCRLLSCLWVTHAPLTPTAHWSAKFNLALNRIHPEPEENICNRPERSLVPQLLPYTRHMQKDLDCHVLTLLGPNLFIQGKKCVMMRSPKAPSETQRTPVATLNLSGMTTGQAQTSQSHWEIGHLSAP